jgi:superfamily II DNA or RNA helicase
LEHGNLLRKLFKKKDIDAPFVQGSMKKEVRSKIKNNIKKNKKGGVVICSKVWREGIDIPSLGKVIYAPGMKDEKLVKQALGRGQRTTKDKSTIKLVDFLDPYKYLAEHSIQRIGIYLREGWL